MLNEQPLLTGFCFVADKELSTFIDSYTKKHQLQRVSFANKLLLAGIRQLLLDYPYTPASVAHFLSQLQEQNLCHWEFLQPAYDQPAT